MFSALCRAGLLVLRSTLRPIKLPANCGILHRTFVLSTTRIQINGFRCLSTSSTGHDHLEQSVWESENSRSFANDVTARSGMPAELGTASSGGGGSHESSERTTEAKPEGGVMEVADADTSGWAENIGLDDPLAKIDKVEAFGTPDWANRLLDLLDRGSATVDFVAENIARFHWTVSEGGTLFSWWGSLVLLAVCYRMLMAPVSYIFMRERGKLLSVYRELRTIDATVSKIRAPFWKKMIVRWSLRKQMYKSAGTSRLRMARYQVWVGVPLTILSTLGIRRMVNTDFLGFSKGGALWFEDLTAPDPLAVLPALMGGIFLRSAGNFKPVGWRNDEVMRKGADSLVLSVQTLTLVFLPMYIQVPSGMFVFWVSNALILEVEKLLYSSSTFREAAGLTTAKDLHALYLARKKVALTRKDMERDLKYVREILDQDFEGREVNEDLVAELNGRLRAELEKGKILVALRSAIRQDTKTGKPYLSVFRHNSKTVGG